ncbi:hypothetical protein JCM10213_003522 [Rhodosporidiobolus nylandii]
MPPKAAFNPYKESLLASALTNEIIRELVVDVAVQEHGLAQLRRERAARAPAGVLGQVDSGLLAVPNGAGGASPAVSPSKKEKDEGLFECLVCGRSIAAPRYAAHLSGCMGLSGSRRGGDRRAATGKSGSGSGSRAGSAAGSDTESVGKANGIKRAASASPAPNGAAKPKKPKPPPVNPGSPAQFLPPHTGAHPLSKTMSLPSSPLTPTSTASSPAASQTSGRVVPPPPPPLASAPPTPSSASMQKRASLPGTPLAPHPNPSTAHLAASSAGGQKRPPHPLAQSPARPPPVAHSDRPDSDSESDSDLDAKPPPVPSVRGAQGQTTGTTAPHKRPPGAGAGGAGSAQKVPRKAARPVQRAAVDSGSDSDDAASADSDSD